MCYAEEEAENQGQAADDKQAKDDKDKNGGKPARKEWRCPHCFEVNEDEKNVQV